MAMFTLVNCSPSEQEIQTSVAEGGARAVTKAQGGTSVTAKGAPKLYVNGGSSSVTVNATGGTIIGEPVGITLDPPLLSEVAPVGTSNAGTSNAGTSNRTSNGGTSNGGNIASSNSSNSGGVIEPTAAVAGSPNATTIAINDDIAGGRAGTPSSGGTGATIGSAMAGQSAAPVDGVAGARTSGTDPTGTEICAGSTETVTAVIACFCGIKDIADCAADCRATRQAEADYYVTCRAAYRALMLCQAALPSNLRACQAGTVITPTRCSNENAAYWACAKLPPS